MMEHESYLVDHCSMPFCKGCGHTHVIKRLNDALIKLQLRPQDICLVTDIGCIGLADGLFASVHTVHTTHGRSAAFAAGIELADSILAGSHLKTVVLIGDGGAMIGLIHLVNAALLNIDLTVILCNNFLFGMTGGQHSTFSPLDFNTQTTPSGNIVPPLDICRVMIDAHTGFVARKLATDKDLDETLVQAITYQGFTLVEVVELCTEHAVTRNQLTGANIKALVEQQGQSFGILSNEHLRGEFGIVYGDKFPHQSDQAQNKVKGYITPTYQSRLQRKLEIIIAGSAGERVQSAAGMFCEAAARSYLYSTQKNDNPVTQGSGFSLSEVCISPTEILYTGIDHPDVVIVTSQDGLRELVERKVFQKLLSSSILIIDASLISPPTDAQIHRLSLRATYGGDQATLTALGYYLKLDLVYPLEAFKQVLQEKTRLQIPVFPEAPIPLNIT